MNDKQERIAAVENEIRESASVPTIAEQATPTLEGQEETTGEQGAPVEAGEPAVERTELEKAEHAFRRKLNRQIRKREELAARLAVAEHELAKRQGVEQPAPVARQEQQVGPPKLEDFNFDPDAHADALVDWKLAQREREAEERKAAEKAQVRVKTFAEREAAFEAEHPDYREVAHAPHVPITQTVAEAIAESEHGPAIAYFLAKNIDRAQAIAQMSPIGVGREIGLIEASLRAAPAATNPPKTVTKAPPPVTTVQASSSGKTPVTQWSVEDHIAAVRATRNR